MRRVENVDSSGSSQEKQEIPLSPRVWLLSDDERQLIQLQLDSFLYNWKLVETDDEYPRFESVWSEFKRMLERFDQFLESEDIPRPEATQYELTYVNLIPQHGVCAHLGEIGNLLPDNRWRDAPDRFLPHPDGWNLRLAFNLPNKLGRLHVHAQDAMRLSDGKKIIRMDLTARGIGIDPSRGKMREWFDVGHEWIVRGFTDLTTESVQTSVWRRSQ